MLDLACGTGRHAISAAALGADVVAIDDDREKLEAARAAAGAAGVTVNWQCADLETLSLPVQAFDLVMIFNYLDRKRLPAFKQSVRPGGYLLYETFLEAQTAFGWGPTSREHLLQFGELFSLLDPFELQFAREAVEVLDGRSKAVASVVARRPDT